MSLSGLTRILPVLSFLFLFCWPGSFWAAPRRILRGSALQHLCCLSLGAIFPLAGSLLRPVFVLGPFPGFSCFGVGGLVLPLTNIQVRISLGSAGLRGLRVKAPSGPDWSAGIVG